MEKSLSKENLSIEEKKELYVATLVHDLKNPLNAQILALEQLYNEKFGGLNLLQKELLKDIISSSKFMNEMISSLLSVYKYENGKVNLHKTAVDIDKLIKTCLKDLTPLAENNSIFINYINNSSSSFAMCDENYFRRVILNLINNIISYSYKNTTSVILLKNSDELLILIFKNTGYPINENLKAHIFDKYNFGENKKSGTGLGLYFSKQIIEAHNGSIELITKNSEIEFVVKIPILKAH